MGHEATGRAGQQRGSAMGAHYRHTPEMAARIAMAVEQRLRVVLEVAEQAHAMDGTLWRAPLVRAFAACQGQSTTAR